MSDETIERLGHLAFSMLKEGDQSPIPLLRIIDPPPAGYTYFGQFIDHNLTEDDTPVRDAGQRESWETVNYRGPWLNLSGIYDRSYDQGGWKELYQDDGVCFRLGKPERANGAQFDLPLNGDEQPILVDDRNNENIIIRQIHVMFLRLHNLAIEELKSPMLSDAELFAKARDRVCWQYQYLVRHDFLCRLCHPDIFEELVLKNEQPQIDWTSGGFSMPVELAQAGLRFGHSLVRPMYTLNTAKPVVTLDKLLSGERRGGLTVSEAVDWNSFLSSTGELAMSIDTAVASPLFGLDSEDIHPYVNSPMPHPPHALPVRTLVRGARSRLPTGQDVARKLNVPIVAPEIVNEAGYDPGEALRSFGFSDQIPLWYYILLEAEVNQRGARLGELGSRLVIETVNGALRHDPNSYLSRLPPGSIPEPWAKTGQRVKTLRDLARLVDLAE